MINCDLLFANANDPHAYISAMLSGRFAGIAVSPFPLQSTILLLQVHMAGQEPPPTLHGCMPEDSWWPVEKSRWSGRNIPWEEKPAKLLQVCEHRWIWLVFNKSSVTPSRIIGCDGWAEDVCADTERLVWSSSAAVHDINPLWFFFF